MNRFSRYGLGLLIGLAGCVSNSQKVVVSEDEKEFYERYRVVRREHLEAKSIYPSDLDCQIIEGFLNKVNESNANFNYRAYLLSEIEDLIQKYRQEHNMGIQEVTIVMEFNIRT